MGTARQLRKVRLRRERVHSAAAEAAQDDSYLDPGQVERDATELYLAVQRAWDERDVPGLRELVGDDLMVEWERRLVDFERKGWHNRVQVLAAPSVSYVGLVNRENDSEDHVTVLIEADLSSYVGTGGGQRLMKDGEDDESVSVIEYWTLARRRDG